MRLTFILLFFSTLSLAQIDSLDLGIPDLSQELVEDYLQNLKGENDDFDFNTLFDILESYRSRPLNINTAKEVDLKELGLLSDLQIISLINYRKVAGDLISIYELQSIPGFDINTIRRIVPFVTIDSNLDDYNLPISRMLTDGKNELFLRWSRILETQKGYTPLPEGQVGSRYLGDPNKLYLRYKHSYSNKLSYGFTAEKDRGEEFFKGSNKQGFDFYSAHFYLRDYNKSIKALALGDYAISLGQGLLLFSGFNYGKSSNVASIKRSSRFVRPYTSVNESNFMRGAAATIGLNDKLDLTLFSSYRGRDGNLFELDAAGLDANISAITSLGDDGLHRTESEIADENAIKQLTLGGSVKWQEENWHIAFNALYDRFNKELIRNPRPYNQFFFNGQNLLNVSTDYAYVYQNFHFFGETAMSDNGSVATINGLLIGLDRKLDLAILYRNYPRDYQALNANPFGETSGGRNENGLYLGLEFRPYKNWTVSAYFDTWRHPWLRFRADAPSKGYEYRGRITYAKKRKFRIFLEIRDEIEEVNGFSGESKVTPLITSRLFQTRLHIANKITSSLELRSRIDVGFASDEVRGTGRGFILYQDVLYKPIGFPLSFTTRFAIFDTDGFRIRYYAYENDLLYTFSVPPYYNKGTRFYINLRYKGIRNMTLEFRYAQTYWSNEETFGSGLEEIQGQTRTEVKAQIKYQF